MWLLLYGLALADTADTGDTADTDPYRDTAFVLEETYTQSSRGCGEINAAAALALVAWFSRFGRSAGRPGAPPRTGPARPPSG